MIQVNAMGDACPIPVVKTLRALKELNGVGTVQTLVDNRVAVENLTRLAESKGCAIETEHLGEKEYRVTITVGEAFIFSLTQQDKLPKTILLYNGGAHLTCEGSPMLDDLKALEAEGVEILTCGTCLNHYGLTEQLRVGGVTNMYVIVEKQMQATKVIRP